MIHDAGVGVPGLHDAERRAQEISMVEGRPVDPAARAQAERELRGEALPPLTSDDADSTGSLSRDPSDPAVDRGRQAPTFEGDDPNEVSEQLVTEGLEEADRDQRLADRTRREPD